MSGLQKITVRIRETVDGWRWTSRYGVDGGTLYPSAGEALEAARELGQRTSPSVVTVEWLPETPIGRAALKALGVSK